MERYAEVGISIELNTSSNVYIGQISSRADHPIFRRVPLNDKDLNDIGKYNQVDLRKRCLSVTTNKISSFVVEPQKISAYLSFRLIFCGKTAAKLLILVFYSFTFRATLRTLTAMRKFWKRYNGYVFYNSPRVWIQPVAARFHGLFFGCRHG